MRKKLSESFDQTLNDSPQTYNSFDIIGSIAITKLPKNTCLSSATIAQTILDRHRNIKTVFSQSSAVSGQFRLRKLTFLSGENNTRTIHLESGCLFAVDVKSCYFSPRLLHERNRIANLVQPSEIVVNMFAGVGCFSVIIAKKVPSSKVYSIDINPDAVKLMEENVRLNRVFARVIPILGDAKLIVENQFQRCADRVLMPLPEKALDMLPSAVPALKPTGGWVHCQLFEFAHKSEKAIEKAEENIAAKLGLTGETFETTFSREVRPIGPNWYQIAVDIKVKR